jgi:hypothetical protein
MVLNNIDGIFFFFSKSVSFLMQSVFEEATAAEKEDRRSRNSG